MKNVVRAMWSRRRGGTHAMPRTRATAVVGGAAIAAGLLLPGCAGTAYVTEYAAADLQPFIDSGGTGLTGSGDPAVALDPIAAAYAVQPAARFPAAIAIARVQGTGYRGQLTGTSSFVVATERSGEDEVDLERFESLEGLRGFSPINGLLLADAAATPMDLRTAAARLHADMLLLYTFSTSSTERDVMPPLSLVTLGLAPTKTQDVTMTASAVLIDVRTGFVYATMEAVEDRGALSNSWNTSEARDRSSTKLEARSLNALLEHFEVVWPRIVKNYGPASGAEPAVTVADGA